MKTKRLLITGSNGFLGNNLADYFISKGYKVFGADLAPAAISPEVEYHRGDLSDQKITSDIFDAVGPNYVINTVALVDLDLCEENTSLAYKVNVQTAENIAKCSKKHGARMMHISTDHLFDGKRSLYSEEDQTSPVNNYGLTKLQGEQACLNIHDGIVAIRTNFYGWSYPSHKATFGEWLYDGLRQRKPIRLYEDYYFTPIDIISLAEALERVMNSDLRGIINIAGSERCSKYEFGLALAETFGLDKSVITKAKMGSDSFKVQRQRDLSLSVEKYERTFNIKLPCLKIGLERFKAGLPREHAVNAR